MVLSFCTLRCSFVVKPSLKTFKQQALYCRCCTPLNTESLQGIEKGVTPPIPRGCCAPQDVIPCLLWMTATWAQLSSFILLFIEVRERWKDIVN